VVERQPAATRRGSWLIVLFAIAVVVAFPLVELLREVAAAGWSSAWEAAGDSAGPIVNTIWTSAIVAVASVVVATVVAVVAREAGGRVAATLRIGMVVPLLIPPFVSALSWSEAYGAGGLLDDLVGLRFPGVPGAAGVVLVMTVNTAPVAFLVVAAALASRTDADLVAAARLSGASPSTAFRTVTLPALRPALLAATVVSFVLGANAFGVPAVLGIPAGFGTVTTRIYQELALSAAPDAFTRVVVLALVLVVLAGAVVVGGDRFANGARRPPLYRADAAATSMTRSSPNVRRAAGVLIAYVVVTTVVPLVALVLTAVTRAAGLSPTPGNWTLANFDQALGGSSGAALGRSVVLAAVAATLVVVLGAIVVWLERRRSSWLGSTVALTFAVPGSALAVAVLLAYGSWLRDTLVLILIAYVAKFWALGHRPLSGAAAMLSPDSLGAARVAGARPVTMVRTIVAPLLAPAVGAAWLLVMLFGVHELTMSSLLYGPGSETLAVVVLNLRQLGDSTLTAAMAVLLTLVTMGAGTGAAWLWRRRPVRTMP
jgi:iron(III) transport system permease protein